MQKKTTEALTIKAPNFQTAGFKLVGTAPYVQNKFSAKALEAMRETQEAGSTARSKKKREAKDFTERYENAIHRTEDGTYGIPAPAFRNSMIDACRMAGFKMTHAKCSLFVQHEGFDFQDGTPLVLFTKGEPHYVEHMVRNATGVVDIRPRPMWNPGWEVSLRVAFDADQFTVTDVANLIMRAGTQIGVGEGRPFSKSSCGMGWGTFRLAEEGE